MSENIERKAISSCWDPHSTSWSRFSYSNNEQTQNGGFYFLKIFNKKNNSSTLFPTELPFLKKTLVMKKTLVYLKNRASWLYFLIFLKFIFDYCLNKNNCFFNINKLSCWGVLLLNCQNGLVKYTYKNIFFIHLIVLLLTRVEISL